MSERENMAKNGPLQPTEEVRQQLEALAQTDPSDTQQWGRRRRELLEGLTKNFSGDKELRRAVHKATGAMISTGSDRRRRLRDSAREVGRLLSDREGRGGR